jgi:hypothetical protein
MAHDRSNGGMLSGPLAPRHRHLTTSVTAVFFTKLAKHLVVLACFAIIGRATGRFDASELTIFFIVACAALFHSAGRMLQRRYARRPPRSGSEHDCRAS